MTSAAAPRHDGDGSGLPPQDLQAPVQRLHYSVTPADALVWQRLPREATGWRKAALFAPAIAAGMVWAASESLGGLLPRLLLTGSGTALLWLATQMAFTLGDRRAARALVPEPQAAALDIHGDHLCEHRGGQITCHAPELIRQVVQVPTHVFLDSGAQLLILPRAAFADDGDMTAFADHWNDLSRAAAP